MFKLKKNEIQLISEADCAEKPDFKRTCKPSFAAGKSVHIASDVEQAREATQFIWGNEVRVDEDSIPELSLQLKCLYFQGEISREQLIDAFHILLLSANYQIPVKRIPLFDKQGKPTKMAKAYFGNNLDEALEIIQEGNISLEEFYLIQSDVSQVPTDGENYSSNSRFMLKSKANQGIRFVPSIALLELKTVFIGHRVTAQPAIGASSNDDIAQGMRNRVHDVYIPCYDGSAENFERIHGNEVMDITKLTHDFDHLFFLANSVERLLSFCPDFYELCKSFYGDEDLSAFTSPSWHMCDTAFNVDGLNNALDETFHEKGLPYYTLSIFMEQFFPGKALISPGCAEVIYAIESGALSTIVSDEELQLFQKHFPHCDIQGQTFKIFAISLLRDFFAAVKDLQAEVLEGDDNIMQFFTLLRETITAFPDSYLDELEDDINLALQRVVEINPDLQFRVDNFCIAHYLEFTPQPTASYSQLR